MTSKPPPWYPGRRLLALEYYLRLAMRYGVGGGGVAWELIADHGRNPLVLLVAAMLATSTDVLGLVRGLIAQAKLERKTLDEIIEEEQQREREYPRQGEGDRK
jgi:hypothetical protein